MSSFASLRARLIVLAFFMILPFVGLFLFVGQHSDTLGRNLILLLVATALALAIAWLGINVLIMRRVNAVLYAVRRLSQGDLSVRTHVADDGSELSQLARAVDELVAAGQQRENERKHTEEALQQEKNLNEMKLQYASMISHEFRNPLAAIRLSSDVLKKFQDKLTDDKRNEHLDKIQSRVTVLVEMLDQLLMITRADTVGLEFNPVSLNLADFCRILIEEMQPDDANRIIFVASDGCTDFKGDEKLLQHIVTNLLSNALKYSPDGGAVNFDIGCDSSQIVMTIQDKGIGIPEADLKNLFETFHRAQNVVGIPGSGLGLAITRRAVEAHGGTISVESKEGVGSTFTVTLPPQYNPPNPPQG